MKIRSEETKSGAAGEIVNQREQQAEGEAAEGDEKCVGDDVVARGKKGVRR